MILVTVLSLGAIGAGIEIIVHTTGFLAHSATTGRALIRHERTIVAQGCTASTTTPTTTPTVTLDPAAALAAGGGTAPGTSDTYGLEGLLEVPKIGLVAPIVEGTGDAQLAVAVGHVPASSQPPIAGTDLLAAHDVTWFSQIDHLTVGDQLHLVTPCATYTFEVSSHRVVPEATPIYQTHYSRLILVTCYPLNALFLTPDRYIVTADLVSTKQTASSTMAPQTPSVPNIDIPAGLSAQGLTLQQNQTPLGSLGESGSPSAYWLQSSAPLEEEAEVLSLYFGAVRAAGQQNQAWWSAIAPHVPLSAAGPLVGATVSRYADRLQPTLDVAGSDLTGGTVVTEPVIGGRTYRVTMSMATESGTLQIASFAIAPTG